MLKIEINIEIKQKLTNYKITKITKLSIKENKVFFSKLNKKKYIK